MGGRRCLIIPAKAPGKCLHIDCGSTENGTKIHVWDRLPLGHPEQLNQEWIWDGEFISSAKAPGKTIHLDCGRTGNGTKLQLWDRLHEGHPDECNEKWALDGACIFSAKDRSKCWHLDEGRTENGTKVHIWDNLKRDHRDVQNQEWKIEWIDDDDSGFSHQIDAPEVWAQADLMLLFATTGQTASKFTMKFQHYKGYDTETPPSSKLHQKVSTSARASGRSLAADVEAQGTSVLSAAVLGNLLIHRCAKTKQEVTIEVDCKNLASFTR